MEFLWRAMADLARDGFCQLSEQLRRRRSSCTVPEAFDYDNAGSYVRAIENQNRLLHQNAILFRSFDFSAEHWKSF
jgi:hypothetical protein